MRYPEKAVSPSDEPADFVMSHCDQSESDREPMEEIWDETEDNWLVRPFGNEGSLSSRTDYPVGPIGVKRTVPAQPTFADPETHQEVMTIISGIVLAAHPAGSRSFVRSRGVGSEDFSGSFLVQGLCEYIARLPHQLMNHVLWLLSAGIYGSGVMEAFYDYVEEPTVHLDMYVDPETMEEIPETFIAQAPVYDDVRFQQFSVRDFYPDHSHQFIDQMYGAARKSRLNAYVAQARGERGIYDKAKVKAAMERRASSKDRRNKSDDVSQLDSGTEVNPAVNSLDMIRYVGYCPIKHKDGFQKREIVILGGETVRDEPWPRRLPWFDCHITPRPGSFWGLSPAELIRHDQDFLNVLKMMLADAVVRVTHPPLLYDSNGGVNLAKLRKWEPDVPVEVTGDPASKVRTLDYRPDLGAPTNMIGVVKQQSRESTSALDSRMGLPFGTKRNSATEAQLVAEAGGTRPELFVRVYESEHLPPLYKYSVGLYREFGTTEEILARVGRQFVYPGASLTDLDLNYDVEFVGSRTMTPQDELNFIREMMAAPNPIVQQLVPWLPLMRRAFEDRGMFEAAAMVGDPMMVQVHMKMAQLLGPQQGMGNGNGEAPSVPSSALMPAQVAGRVM